MKDGRLPRGPLLAAQRVHHRDPAAARAAGGHPARWPSTSSPASPQAMNRRPMQLSPAALEALLAYRWPGNVRELQNAIERAVVVATGPVLEPAGPAAARHRRTPPARRPARSRRRRRPTSRPSWSCGLEHHPGGAHPRRGPRDALQQDPEVRARRDPPMGLSGGPPPVDAIHLLPLGPSPSILAEDLASRLSRRVPCRAAWCDSPAELDLPRLAGPRPDRRGRAARRLEAGHGSHDVVLVGQRPSTSRSRSSPSSSGARARAAAPLWSPWRAWTPLLRPAAADGERWPERAVTEILHELGHVASLAPLRGRGLPDALRRLRGEGGRARVRLLRPLRGPPAGLAACAQAVGGGLLTASWASGLGHKAHAGFASAAYSCSGGRFAAALEQAGLRLRRGR